MIQQATAEGGADGSAQLPIKGSEQVMVKEVTVDAHVVHELGHVSALPGEHHLSDKAGDRRAHFVAGAHRFPGTRIDLLAKVKGAPPRDGVRVLAEDSDGVMNVRCVPRNSSGGLSRAHRSLGWPRGRKGGV